MNSRLGIKQFRQDGCLSYLVYDRETKRAALIDPHLDAMDDYREYLASHGLKLTVTLETHIHADHFSASHLLRDEFGTEIGMGEHTPSSRVSRKLRDGDMIELGSVHLRVLATPGHTPDSVCYVTDGAVFTGDTLLIGATGRTDFPGADARHQWHSVREVIGKLPPETVVFPGHDYNELLFSTVATELRKNPHLQETAESFVALKSAECIAGQSDEIKRRVAFNAASSPAAPAGGPPGAATACGAPSRDAGQMTTIGVEKYSQKLKEKAPGTLFVDVREPDEFVDGHMPGARNIPLSEVALHVDEITAAKRVYFSCLGGFRSGMATKTLNYLGHPDAVNVTGGYKAWSSAGLPTQPGSK